MAVERDRGVLRQRFDLRHHAIVEQLGAGDLRDLALFRRAHVVQLRDLAAVDQRFDLLRRHFTHHRRPIRVLDLEAGARRILDEIDRRAVGARRARAIELHRDAVGLDGDVRGFFRADVELVLPARCDRQVDDIAGRAVFERGRELARRARRHDDLRGLRRRDQIAELLLELAALEHLAHDVGAADELALDEQLRERRPVRVLLHPAAHVRIAEHVDGGVLRDQGVQDVHDRRAESALRKAARALHEQHDGIRARGANRSSA